MTKNATVDTANARATKAQIEPGGVDWHGMARELKQNKGEWMLVATNTYVANANHISGTKPVVAMRPAGDFEATSRKEKGAHGRIYARYTGKTSARKQKLADAVKPVATPTPRDVWATSAVSKRVTKLQEQVDALKIDKALLEGEVTRLREWAERVEMEKSDRGVRLKIVELEFSIYKQQQLLADYKKELGES